MVLTREMMAMVIIRSTISDNGPAARKSDQTDNFWQEKYKKANCNPEGENKWLLIGKRTGKSF